MSPQTIESVAQRVLDGLPYEFAHAVENRLYGLHRANTSTADGIALEATMVIIRRAHQGGTDQHVYRAIEASLPAYHLWRHGRRLADLDR